MKKRLLAIYTSLLQASSSSAQTGISESRIDASIPPLQDNSGNWITFPEGTNMDIANQVMNIYDYMGSGYNGSTRRTINT